MSKINIEHTIQADLTVKTRKIEGVFCDQLQGLIAEFFNVKEVRDQKNYGS